MEHRSGVAVRTGICEPQEPMPKLAVQNGDRCLELAPVPPELDLRRLPRHVAIIMDGNGRWARRQGLPREAGHRAGVRPVRRITEACARLGIDHLTLYAFSAENWTRPPLEVAALMRLLRRTIRRQIRTFARGDVRFRMIGRREGLPSAVLREVDRLTESTARNSGLMLNLALNYGGRQEILEAVRDLVGRVAAGALHPDEIDEQALENRLGTAGQPDPDLLIRTSGELRISNFLLWQLAYSEMYCTPVLWPDFDEQGLYRALLDYQHRDRRYGGVASDPDASAGSRR